MIKSVTFEKTIYNDLPYKFEAGTPNIAGGIGLGEIERGTTSNASSFSIFFPDLVDEGGRDFLSRLFLYSVLSDHNGFHKIQDKRQLYHQELYFLPHHF